VAARIRGDMSVRVSAARLEAFARTVLEAASFEPGDAALCAHAFVEADVRGIASHGVLHLPNLVRRVALGLVSTAARPRAVRESAATLLLDGEHAPGPVVAWAAMRLACQKARSTGVGLVAVRNSGHFGMAALYAEQASEQGLIGVAMSNSTPLLVPAGAARPLIGTNPFAIAVADGGAGFRFDMGMGELSIGEVRVRRDAGELLPSGVAADAGGGPTRDPADVLAGGGVRPVGGHRGMGLALAVEVLAGVLPGAAVASEVGSLFVDYDRPQGTGHLMLAIDPGAFGDPRGFRERLAGLIGHMRAGSGDAARPLRLPGDRSVEHGRESRVHGVTLEPATHRALGELAGRFGVSMEGLGS
jgi:LDH2 family malate/lactate/ureidoglycolate dehydrogenase